MTDKVLTEDVCTSCGEYCYEKLLDHYGRCPDCTDIAEDPKRWKDKHED